MSVHICTVMWLHLLEQILQVYIHTSVFVSFETSNIQQLFSDFNTWVGLVMFTIVTWFWTPMLMNTLDPISETFPECPPVKGVSKWYTGTDGQLSQTFSEIILSTGLMRLWS